MTSSEAGSYRHMLRNVTWLTAGNAAVKPLWFVFITAFCMRVLDTGGYGVMTTALSLMSIAGLFSDLGTYDYTIREVARDRGAASRFLTNLLPARAVLGLAVLGLALGIGRAAGYTPPEVVSLAFAGLYVLALRLTEFCRAFFRAFEVLHYEAVSLFVEKLFVISAGVALLLVDRAPQGTLAGMAVGMWLTLAVNVVWIHRRLARLDASLFDGAFVRRTFARAFPLGLSLLFTTVFLSSGTVLLEALQGAGAAGQYGAAYRILETLLLLPSIVLAAVLPRLSNLSRPEHRDRFRRVLRASLLAAGGVAVLASAALTVAAPTLIHLLAPNRGFDAAGPLLRVLVWAFPLMTWSNLIGSALIAVDRQRFLAVVLGIGATLLVGLNLLLVPRWSFYGTAAALILSQAFVLVCYYWQYRRTMRRAPLPEPAALALGL